MADKKNTKQTVPEEIKMTKKDNKFARGDNSFSGIEADFSYIEFDEDIPSILQSERQDDNEKPNTCKFCAGCKFC